MNDPLCYADRVTTRTRIDETQAIVNLDGWPQPVRFGFGMGEPASSPHSRDELSYGRVGNGQDPVLVG